MIPAYWGHYLMKAQTKCMRLQRHILTMIVSSPGCTFQDIVTVYNGIHRSEEIRYSLRWLERRGAVQVQQNATSIRCYPTGKVWSGMISL